MTRAIRWRILSLQAVTILVLGFVARVGSWAHSFTHDQIRSQLTEQQIVFPVNYLLRLTALIVLLPLLLLSGVATAASVPQRPASTSLKSLALQLSDIQHVYGPGLLAGVTGSTRKSADVTCANAPTLDFSSAFTTSNGGPVRRTGLLNVTALLSQYKTTAGPRCNFKYDLFQRKTLGATLGIVTVLRGIGDQAVLIRLDPMKNEPGSPVYALDARFIRGRYLVLVMVQMNRRVRPADVTSLARAVDSRIKRSG